MKKRFVVIFFTALLLLCACQPTPEEPVVVQKDFDVMIEKAKQTPVSDTVTVEGETSSSAVQPTAPAETSDAAKPGERVVDSFTGRSNWLDQNRMAETDSPRMSAVSLML